MKIFNFDAPCIVKPFLKHEDLKDSVLDYIEHDMSKRRLTTETMDIHSDWGTYGTGKKNYWKVLSDDINEYMSTVTIEDLGYQGFELSNFWYQQYTKGGKHGWHVHLNCMYTSVYYLEFPEGSPPTEFMHSISKEIIPIDFVKEGDIITFPSYIVHRAAENTSENRKTILSWHCNVEYGHYQK